MKHITINYEGSPCYNIHFRQDFNDLTQVFKNDLNKNYDNICIVTDSNVASLYLGEVVSIFKGLCDNVYSFSFDAGEASKNLNTVSMLYEHLILKKFTRNKNIYNRRLRFLFKYTAKVVILNNNICGYKTYLKPKQCLTLVWDTQT